jgi:hypothetical protein
MAHTTHTHLYPYARTHIHTHTYTQYIAVLEQTLAISQPKKVNTLAY